MRGVKVLMALSAQFVLAEIASREANHLAWIHQAERIPKDTAYFYGQGHGTDAGADRVARERTARMRK